AGALRARDRGGRRRLRVTQLSASTGRLRAPLFYIQQGATHARHKNRARNTLELHKKPPHLLTRRCPPVYNRSTMFLLPDYRVRQRDYLLNISRALTSQLDLGEVLRMILQAAASMLSGEVGLIALRVGDT